MMPDDSLLGGNAVADNNACSRTRHKRGFFALRHYLDLENNVRQNFLKPYHVLRDTLFHLTKLLGFFQLPASQSDMVLFVRPVCTWGKGESTREGAGQGEEVPCGEEEEPNDNGEPQKGE